MPDWLRTLQLSAGPDGSSVGRGRGRGRDTPRRRAAMVDGSSRRLWWTSAALLVAGGLVMAFLAFGERTQDPDRLEDRTFARAADARCEAAGTLLGADAGRVLEGDEAERIERITDAWAATAADLRALPVLRADTTRVDRWLATWDRWVLLGYDYADAVRRGSADEADAILADAAAPKTALRRFAVVNDMPSCAFG